MPPGRRFLAAFFFFVLNLNYAEVQVPNILWQLVG